MRLTSLLLAIAAILAAALFLLRDLPPPDRIVFAAGIRGGGYWQIAEQYQAELARDGIAVEILETAGSVENLGLLDTGQADVGLLQGGVPTQEVPIEALGTVFVEPIVMFARRDASVPANPGRWSGLRIDRGTKGSGTRVAIDHLLEALGVYGENALFELGGRAAAEALLAGEIDLALFVAPFGADYVDLLLEDPRAVLLRLEHAEAVSLRLPHSRVVTVASGALSLDPVQPAEALPMIALMARLAAVEDLHPAAIDRLVVAARRIHGQNGIFSRQGEFPNAQATDMPIDPGALKLLIEGQSAYHEWLPYWIAAQIRRVLLVVLPLLFLVLPLVRMLPVVYRWSMRRRVWHFYSEIREIETELESTTGTEALQRLDTRLASIDQKLSTMRLPLPFRGGAYDARVHVELVRRHIGEMLRAEKGT